jgi:hypothetical protein
MVGLLCAACQKHQVAKHEAEHPVEVKKIEGSDVNRVTMTERAIERLDLKTDRVREQRVARSTSPKRVVPHSALIYDPKGETWVYTSPEPRTFVKHKVEVDYVEGDLAVLNDGPPAGTTVVSAAVAQVYGADSGVGH